MWFYRPPNAVIGTVENDGSAVVNVKGTRTENVGDRDLASAVDAPVLGRERGRERDRLEEEMTIAVVAGAESERETVAG